MDNTLELVKSLFQLLFLFGLVVVLAWWTTRLLAVRLGGGGRGRPLRVLHHIPAGRDRTILLLEVAGQYYLIGATSQQINLLDTLDDPDVIRRLVAEGEAHEDSPLGQVIQKGFSDLLSKALRRPAQQEVEAPASAPADGAADEADRLKERIDRLRRLQDK